MFSSDISISDDEWEDDEDENSSTSSDGLVEASVSQEDMTSVEDDGNLTLPSEVRISRIVARLACLLNRRRHLSS